MVCKLVLRSKRKKDNDLRVLIRVEDKEVFLQSSSNLCESLTGCWAILCENFRHIKLITLYYKCRSMMMMIITIIIINLINLSLQFNFFFHKKKFSLQSLLLHIGSYPQKNIYMLFDESISHTQNEYIQFS